MSCMRTYRDRNSNWFRIEDRDTVIKRDQEYCAKGEGRGGGWKLNFAFVMIYFFEGRGLIY